MSKERMSKLQYQILEALQSGKDYAYQYNALAKFICSTYCADKFSMKQWLLEGEKLPNKFAVSFTRATQLLIKKGLITRGGAIYGRSMTLELTRKGEAFVKKQKVFQPDKKKRYKWI